MGLNTEVGGATADSYVTVAEADTYMSQKRRYANIWTAMNTGQKEDSLRQAALEIDYLAVYKGNKYFDVPEGNKDYQAREFPRNYQEGGSSNNSGDKYIPIRVKEAQIEQALWIETRGPNSSPDLKDIEMMPKLSNWVLMILRRFTNTKVKRYGAYNWNTLSAKRQTQ